MMISELLSSVPSWLLFAVIVGGSIVLACACLLQIRHQKEKVLIEIHDNEAIGFVFATVSVVYAVLLAFIVITVWESYGDAQRAVSDEAAAIVTTARYSASFPEPARSVVHDHLRDYTEVVINDEWKLMQQTGGDTFGSPQAIDDMQIVFSTVQQKLPPNAINADAMNSVTELSKDRLLRLETSEDLIPDSIWLVLVAGAVIVVYFSLLLRVENAELHLLLVALLTGSIAICIWLIAIINSPFGGEVQVSAAPLHYALHVIDLLPR